MIENSEKPLFIFDGDCGFCRFWMKRWKKRVGDRVRFKPYQDVHEKFPSISLSDFRRSSKLVLPSKKVLSGAGGIFKLISYEKRKGFLWFLYNYLPLFSFLSEIIYKSIAKNRPLFAKLTGLIWGSDPEPSKFSITSWIFVKVLSLIYFGAFLSLFIQIKGLIGPSGILPVSDFLNMVSETLPGLSGVFNFPTLAWISGSDLFLVGITIAGMIFSVLLFLNFFSILSAFLSWVLYLSLTIAGQEFLSFQWDTLLLEAGFIGLFLVVWRSKFSLTDFRKRFFEAAKSSFIPVLLTWWLSFRLIFEAGLVKLASGDPVWRNLKALTSHYETQPIPNPISWFLNNFPEWFHKISAFLTLSVELLVPFLFFLPRRIRFAGGFAVILHQIFIFLTGNYTMFNILTIALALMLFDDLFWKNVFGKVKGGLNIKKRFSTSSAGLSWKFSFSVVFLVVAVLVGSFQIGAIFNSDIWTRPVEMIREATSPFYLVNSYGLFANMTTTRPEIILEGSSDGEIWKEYDFKYKPDKLDEMPHQVAPHQPRLDWQMWFSGLTAERSILTGEPRYDRWFISFVKKLLEGEKNVVSLLSGDTPFKDAPPEFLRARLFLYEFNDYSEKRKTGNWWSRRLIGTYIPAVSLEGNELKPLNNN